MPEERSPVDSGEIGEEARCKSKREREREEGGRESRRVVFVIKLTRMGLINSCERHKTSLVTLSR